MTEESHPNALRLAAKIAAIVVGVAGGAGLLGWTLGLSSHATLMSGLPPIKPGTALGLVIGAICLGLHLSRRDAPWVRYARGLAALGVITLGVITCLDYAIKPVLRFDHRLATLNAIEAGMSVGSSASILDGLNLAMVGGALLLASRRFKAMWIVDLLVVVPGLVSLLALLGYLCHVPLFYGSRTTRPGGEMAMHAAVSFVALGLGLLAVYPQRGLMQVLTSSTSGGMVARRLLLVPVMIPLLTGWIQIVGRKGGLLDAEIAGWFFSFLNIFGFTAAIWWISTLLLRSELIRRSAEKEVRSFNEQLEQRVIERTAELKQAQDWLRESASFLVRSQEIAHLGSWEMRLDAADRSRPVHLNWSDETYRILGFSPRLVVPTSELFYSRVHPDDRARVRAMFDSAIKNHESYFCEHRVQAPDGTVRIVLERGNVQTDEATGSTRMLGTIQDITERKQAEEALSSERNLLRLLIDNLPSCIYVKDPQGRYLVYNESSCRMVGLRAEWEAVGKTVFDFFPKEIAELYTAGDQRVLSEGRPLIDHEEPTVNHLGERRWYSTTKLPLRDARGVTMGLLGISHDITERKRAEEALRNNERRFRALIEHGSDSIAVTDGDGVFKYLSPSVTVVEGYSPEELIGRSAFDTSHPDDVDRLRHNFRQLRSEDGSSLPMVWRRRHQNGQWLWLEGVATNLLHDPAIRGIVTNYRDVSRRKAAEDRIQAELSRMHLLRQITRAIAERQDLTSIFQITLKTLENEMPVAFGCICLHDEPSHSLTVSDVGSASAALAEGAGLKPSSVMSIEQNGLAKCLGGQLVYEPDASTVPFPLTQGLAQRGIRSVVAAPLFVDARLFGLLLVGRREPGGFTSGQCEFLRQLSEHIALAAHQAGLYRALQQAYEDLRQSQQTLLQQERLRALGQMASGIAHDINNAISPVALYTDSLLHHEVNLSPRARNYLEIIQRANSDVAATVARMREFYRQRESTSTLLPLLLNEMVQQVVEFTRARWHDMPQQRGVVIEIITDLDPDIPKILGLESEVREVLINFVFNAVDAMPDGGILTVRTRSDTAPASAAGPAGARCVVLEVTDTGVGMDDATRRRCLEPFFTTKGERGTGLGLAMVYGVLQRHEAVLEIESAVGCGTTMRVRFPSIEATAKPPEPPAETHGPPPIVRRRILIVDDDPIVAQSLVLSLRMDGHDIESAANGREGVDVFTAADGGGRPFDIVITDLGMPHMDGHQVAAAVKQLSRGTRVILLTGWGQRFIDDDGPPPNVDHVLSKPPTLKDLRDTIQLCSPREHPDMTGPEPIRSGSGRVTSL